jgi:hypothetical protein
MGLTSDESERPQQCECVNADFFVMVLDFFCLF